MNIRQQDKKKEWWSRKIRQGGAGFGCNSSQRELVGRSAPHTMILHIGESQKMQHVPSDDILNAREHV